MLLFDLIIEQLLSGVRADDGRRIDFCKENRNDTLYSLAEMRQNFQEAIEKHKAVLLGGDSEEIMEVMGDILETIPILSECVHGCDVDYFDLQIRRYVKEYLV
jgi:ADP-ribosylglycohydrolase